MLEGAMRKRSSNIPYQQQLASKHTLLKIEHNFINKVILLADFLR